MTILPTLRLSQQDPVRILCYGLAFKCCWVLLVILYAGIGLAPDEAQYWTWAKELAWGYYSKPPGIAWQIALTTAFFGDSELGIRISALGMSLGLSLAVYHVGRCGGLERRWAVWAALCIAWSPLGLLASILTTTDGGLTLFWTLAWAPLLKGIRDHEAPNWLVFASYIAMGALFKWPIYLLWLVAALGCMCYPIWRNPRVGIGLAVSLLALIPSLIWNSMHEWATFRHVATQVGGGGYNAPPGNPLDFFIAQVGLMSPILFGGLILGLIWGVRDKGNFRFIACVSTAFLLIYQILACCQKMQGNWVAYVYPSAFLCCAAWVAAKPTRACLGSWGVSSSVLLMSAVMLIPHLQDRSLVNIPYRASPFRASMGWKQLGALLDDYGYDPEQHFLAGEKYQSASILSFYATGQKRAHFLNLYAARKNQFSYWPGLDTSGALDAGFFVSVENAPRFQLHRVPNTERMREDLLEYFKEVKLLGTPSLFEANGDLAKGACIFFCQGNRRKAIEDPERY